MSQIPTAQTFANENRFVSIPLRRRLPSRPAAVNRADCGHPRRIDARPSPHYALQMHSHARARPDRSVNYDFDNFRVCCFNWNYYLIDSRHSSGRPQCGRAGVAGPGGSGERAAPLTHGRSGTKRRAPLIKDHSLSHHCADFNAQLFARAARPLPRVASFPAHSRIG